MPKMSSKEDVNYREGKCCLNCKRAYRWSYEFEEGRCRIIGTTYPEKCCDKYEYDNG